MYILTPRNYWMITFPAGEITAAKTRGKLLINDERMYRGDRILSQFTCVWICDYFGFGFVFGFGYHLYVVLYQHIPYCMLIANYMNHVFS